MKKHDIASGIVFLCLGLFIIFYSPVFDIGSLKTPGSGFMPFLSGVIICLFSGLTLLNTFFYKAGEIESRHKKVKFRNLILAVLALIAYPLLIKWAGFVICSFFLILITMRYAGSQTWVATILGGGLASILSYLLFEVLLKSQLPRGILGF